MIDEILSPASMSPFFWQDGAVPPGVTAQRRLISYEARTAGSYLVKILWPSSYRFSVFPASPAISSATSSSCFERSVSSEGRFVGWLWR